MVLSMAGLTGCAAPFVEGAHVAVDRATVNSNMPAAKSGDAKAQFKVGDALCCSVSDNQPFYNTEQSTEWLCKSAAQGYTQAMVRLGRIYSGHTVEGLRLARRVAAAVGGDAPVKPVAWAWFSFAADTGDADAAMRAKDLAADMTPEQKVKAEAIHTGGRAQAPCTAKDIAALRA